MVVLLALGCARRVPPEVVAAPPERVWATPTDSAPGVIRGVVRYSASGAPIAGATIRLFGWTGEVYTDAAGRFALAPKPAGEYAFRASRIGYDPARAYLMVSPGRGVHVEVRLPTRAILLKGPGAPAP